MTHNSQFRIPCRCISNQTNVKKGFSMTSSCLKLKFILMGITQKPRNRCSLSHRENTTISLDWMSLCVNFIYIYIRITLLTISSDINVSILVCFLSLKWINDYTFEVYSKPNESHIVPFLPNAPMYPTFGHGGYMRSFFIKFIFSLSIQIIFCCTVYNIALHWLV